MSLSHIRQRVTNGVRDNHLNVAISLTGFRVVSTHHGMQLRQGLGRTRCRALRRPSSTSRYYPQRQQAGKGRHEPLFIARTSPKWAATPEP